VAFFLLARVLSPEGFGAYGILTSAVFLAGQIGNLGLRQSAAYRIGQGKMTDGEAIGAMTVLWPISSVACGLAVTFLNRDLFAQMGASSSIALLIATATILLLTLLQGVFLGRGQIAYYSTSDAGPRVAQSIFVALLWLTGTLTLASAVWSFTAGFLLLTPLLLWVALKNVRVPLGAVRQAPDMIRHGFLFALSVFLVTLQGRVGVFFLHGAHGATDAGQFFAAQRANEIFLELASAVGLVLFSDTARSSNSRQTLIEALRTATSMFVVFLVIGLVAAFLAPSLVKILLGPKYLPATDALRILAIGLAPAAAVRILNSVIAGLGKPYLSAAIVLGALVFNAGMCAWLAPSLGPKGAAISLVVAQFIAALTYWFICVTHYKIRLQDIMPGKSGQGTGLRSSSEAPVAQYGDARQ